jgi:hypothetical protein
MKTLRLGSAGDDVASLQRALNLTPDGVFGAITEAAVRDFQRSAGLAADGVAGPQTLAKLFGQPSRALSAGDIAAAADKLGIDEASMRAVLAVESAGAGFLADGRPKILFERHIMRRRLEAIGRDADLLAKYLPEIINAERGGYLGGAAEHDRLHLARQIDPDSAVCSASWGLFQIMGFHWAALGYESPSVFSGAMATDEAAQLDAFARFMRTNPSMHDALRDRRWADFARLYNGPAYAANQYDLRLAVAYKRFS